MIGWGLVFFLISTFILPLKYLGWYELVFWFILFFPARWLVGRDPLSIAVLFDDRCNLCDRTVRILAGLDIFGQVEFRPIRRNLLFAEQHGVTLKEGLTDLVGVALRDGQRFDGYALYLTLARRMPVLWPVLIPLEFGRFLRIGPRLYRLVADRRIRMFGVCTTSTIPDRFVPARQSSSSISPTQVWPVAVSSIIIALAALSVAFLMRLPIRGADEGAGSVAGFSQAAFGAAPLGFGIGKINVFNEYDLKAFQSRLTTYFSDRHLFKVSIDAENNSEFYWNDRNYYRFFAYLRAMSRTNIGCDANYFSTLGDIYADSVKLDQAISRNAYLNVSIVLNAWPSKEDFQAYRALDRGSVILCRASFDLSNGDLISLDFHQEGVDEALRRAKLPRIFSAANMLTALSYPCRDDIGWINTLVEAQQPFAGNRELIDAAHDLIPQRYGEFELACAARVHAVTKLEPRLVDPALLLGSGPSCDAGLELMRKLQIAAPDSSVLKGEIGADLFFAEEAKRAGNQRVRRCRGDRARTILGSNPHFGATSACYPMRAASPIAQAYVGIGASGCGSPTSFPFL